MVHEWIATQLNLPQCFSDGVTEAEFQGRRLTIVGLRKLEGVTRENIGGGYGEPSVG